MASASRFVPLAIKKGGTFNISINSVRQQSPNLSLHRAKRRNYMIESDSDRLGTSERISHFEMRLLPYFPVILVAGLETVFVLLLRSLT